MPPPDKNEALPAHEEQGTSESTQLDMENVNIGGESQPVFPAPQPPSWSDSPVPHPQSYSPRQQQAWCSPVGQQPPTWEQYHQRHVKTNGWLWALLGAIGAVVMAVAAYFVFRTGADPLRTLEEFPVEAYLRNYESVLGSRFRAEFILDADLGGLLGKGRLFSFRSASTGRILPILIGDDIGQSIFDKGQRYQLELEVGAGGVIFARSCRKS